MTVRGRYAPLLLVGIASIASQAILLRELLARGGGNEIVLTLDLAIWLAGSAVGSRVWGGVGSAGRHSAASLLLLGSLMSIVALALARLLPSLGSVPGEPPRPLALAAFGLFVLFPTAYLTAGSFPVAARGAPNAARAYIVEAIGAIAGGIATTILFVLRVPPLPILSFVLAGALATVTLAQGATGGMPRTLRSSATIGAVVLVVMTLTGVTARFDRALFTRAWVERHSGLLLDSYAQTPTRLLAVALREGERWLLADDTPREVLDDPYRDEATAALLLAAGPSRPRRVLLVDFGSTGVARALKEVGMDEVACLLPDREDTSLTHPVPGVSYVIGDPRRSLRRVPPGWDVIAIAGGEAMSVSANRLWTTEAFAAMADRLAPDGVVVAITPGGDAAPSPEARAWRASVVASLALASGEPPQVIDADRTVIASGRRTGAASLDPDSLAARYGRGGWRLATYPPERFAVEYPRDRLRPSEEMIHKTIPNSDARPSAFAHAVARWMRRSGLTPPPRALVAALVLVLVVITLTPRRRATTVLLATGAASMGLDLLVLMAYQARVGMLQAGLGALLGSFLGGTAAGARLGISQKLGPVGLCLAQAAIAAGATLVLPRVPTATVLYAVLAFLVGASCGAPFPFASRALGAANAWSADAIGGIFGALLFLLTISQGIIVAGFVLAAMPLLAAARAFLMSTAPGSSARTSDRARP